MLAVVVCIVMYRPGLSAAPPADLLWPIAPRDRHFRSSLRRVFSILCPPAKSAMHSSMTATEGTCCGGSLASATTPASWSQTWFRRSLPSHRACQATPQRQRPCRDSDHPTLAGAQPARKTRRPRQTFLPTNFTNTSYRLSSGRKFLPPTSLAEGAHPSHRAVLIVCTSLLRSPITHQPPPTHGMPSTALCRCHLSRPNGVAARRL
mmetsp:Transcript_8301/g.24932  ORF Transcript_8301/g.24932 Transcript_8301/m.24932 type:complete len:206 (-) Transcript_8301:37-654(-)